MCKPMSVGSLKRLLPTNYSFMNLTYSIYIYKQDLVLNIKDDGPWETECPQMKLIFCLLKIIRMFLFLKFTFVILVENQLK